MPPIRSRRLAALLTIGALGVGSTAAAAPAQASLLGGLLGGGGSTNSQGGLLGGLLPDLGAIITQTGQTLGSLVPGLGGVLTGVTGTVGGIVGGVQDTVEGVLDQTLGGVLGGESGVLPNNVVNNLVGTLLGNSTATPGTPATGKSGGPIVLSGGQVSPGGVILDAAGPRPTVTVLSKLKQIGASGKMRIEIRMNEPGIVAVAGTVRPGAAVKARKRRKAAHSRKAIKVPRIVLAYRQAGKLVATVRLSRAAQRSLGASKNAAMSVGTVAVDVFKNQDSDTERLAIRR